MSNGFNFIVQFFIKEQIWEGCVIYSVKLEIIIVFFTDLYQVFKKNNNLLILFQSEILVRISLTSHNRFPKLWL
jgi:hypothetical protein